MGPAGTCTCSDPGRPGDLPPPPDPGAPSACTSTLERRGHHVPLPARGLRGSGPFGDVSPGGHLVLTGLLWLPGPQGATVPVSDPRAALKHAQECACLHTGSELRVYACVCKDSSRRELPGGTRHGAA